MLEKNPTNIAPRRLLQDTDKIPSMSSINKTELKKFSKIADQWWDKEGEFKILHSINPIRLTYITDTIKRHFCIKDSTIPFSKLDILDIGCGGGLITVPLYKLGANITGIDAIEGNIETAQQYASQKNLEINYLKSTVEEMVSSTNKYDVVLCLEVIEHIDHPANFIKNIASLVKPDGMVIMSTLNRTIKSYILAILIAEYVLCMVPKKTHDYNKLLKPSEIFTMFSKHSMTIKELKGLTYNMFAGNWQLSNDIDVNYFAYIVR